MTLTLKAMGIAYAANLGRALLEGEGSEFARKFGGADLELLRAAIDAYFWPPPAFPTLPGLHATYQRLVGERTAKVRAASEKAERENGPCASREEMSAWAREVSEQILAPVIAKKAARAAEWAGRRA